MEYSRIPKSIANDAHISFVSSPHCAKCTPLTICTPLKRTAPPDKVVHPLSVFLSKRYTFSKKNGNFDRIAYLFFLCYDERKDEAEGLSALPDDDW